MADTAINPGDTFTLQVAHRSPLTRAAFAAARPLLSAVWQLPAYRRIYALAQSGAGESFESRVLMALDLRVRVRTRDGGDIPAQGPLIVAANHPTGALDGLVVLEAVRRVRADVRLIANHLLAAIPELHESCFFVDPFDGRQSAARSLQGLRAAHLWLRNGGALVMFPAGEVAWRADADARRHDSPWLPTVGRLSRATRAAVLPVFIDGRNSRSFYAAGAIHPRLRTLLLPRELLRQRGRTVPVVVGRALAPAVTAALTTAEAATSRIREAVDRLARQSEVPSSEKIAAPVAAALLAKDVDALPYDARLLSSGVYEVCCAPASMLPHVLGEIGRLREAAFRGVGEGTGRALDLDRFDEHYRHLFVWNRARRQIVGAYRVAAIEETVASHGVDGLYTSTLFRYDRQLLRRLSPGFELGRSFVRAEYQRNYNALLLLWRGIGRLVARPPECRFLFGPVSISARYQDSSQRLLRAYLAQNHHDAALAELVRATNPPSPIAPPASGDVAVANVEELDALISRLEHGRGIPVLLRHYLRLNATLLGFNIDPAFGDALDALMAVDLTRLPLAILQRYIGRDSARQLLARHRQTADVSQPAA